MDHELQLKNMAASGVLLLLICLGACDNRMGAVGPQAPKQRVDVSNQQMNRKEPDRLVIECLYDRVILARKPFQARGRRIDLNPKSYPGGTLIDGLYAWGSAGVVPHTELTDFDLELDGQMYTLPRDLWVNCYDPRFFTQANDAWGEFVMVPDIIATLTPNRTLLICFAGSDAGGLYRAFYEIDRSRKTCKRTIMINVDYIAEVRSGKLIHK